MKHILYTLSLILIASTASAEPLVTESTSDSKVTTDSNTTIKSPPPSAISPSINTSNSDLCTVGVSGAVQTQILGLSAGKTVRDLNCERLKNAKTLYDMGMKVAAVSTMCQDKQVFDAMMMAGTPCPYEGKIGAAAKIGWESHEAKNKHEKNGKKEKMDVKEAATFGGLSILSLLLLL